jgi:hypothetical protein
VGSKSFIETIKEKLGILAKGGKFLKTVESFSFGKIREPKLPILISKMAILRIKTPIIGI